jgi:threonine/homoserine/homoserine lactone efflux protein
VSLSSFLGFLLAVALLAMVPGPATALVIRRTALDGRRAAFPLIAGIEVGIYLWAIAAALGLAALVAASTTAFVVFKAVGAGVLVLLGIRAWRSSRHIEDLETVDGHEQQDHRWRAFGIGAVTNLANPKAAAFAFAFYPQFIPRGVDVLRTTLLLALVQVLVDASWYLVVATAVGKARDFFARRRVRQRLERVTGTVLVALGVRLAVEHT